MGIQGMVTRKGWNGEVWGGNQKISAAEAIRIYTLNGAHASFEERIKGSITPGKLADTSCWPPIPIRSIRTPLRTSRSSVP